MSKVGRALQPDAPTTSSPPSSAPRVVHADPRGVPKCQASTRHRTYRPVVTRERRLAAAWTRLGSENFFQVLGWLGPAEVEALGEIAAERLELIELVLGLYPLGDRCQIHVVCERDHRCGDG